ncbi:TonB-dependent receptor [Lutibacter profundi]|uniref:TonB-dependent receptor n=1 Tax=Lutibacter profundi TaxID=1622118 RepID=A0A0X8G4T6_9FLAO|nr:TonB-dependent receptor [Lutibacter profundi]AMC10054.1 TonB-dependent receptor [Lutibacter profundi]
MKKIILGLLLLISSFAYSQTTVKGTVVDKSGSPIPGVNIIISGTDVGTTTDFDGNYEITTQLTGEHELKALFMGYFSQTKTINFSGIVTVDFILNESVESLEDVVLTATSTRRSQKQSPLSITSIKQKDIIKLSANSQADIIRSVPGITAEGGGGETATNVFVRGLPSGGQYVFNPLQYDGMPLMSTFGLNSSAHDVYARPDVGFKGVEFVRGGAAVLYGAGSVAGIINYTSKTGDSNPENLVNVEWANEGRIKTDFYTGGQLGGEDSNTYYALTGFMRYDEGPINTGLPTKGVQLRANIKKKFDNGSFTIHGQFINDNAQFFMPLPLEGGSRSRLAGNDGEDVYQLLPSQLANVSFNTPGGIYKSPIADGVSTQGGYLMADFNYRFDNNLKFKSKIKYANYKHSFALYIGGNGAQGNPISLNDYVNGLDAGNLGYSATYQGSSEQISGSDLVIDNLHIDRLRPMTDYSGEASLIKRVETDNGSHNITVGTFISRTEAEDINYQFRVLSEFNNNPQIVNLSYTNASGNNVIYSQQGIYNRIGMTSNKYLSQNKSAFYATDEMIFDKWRFDVGFRIENTKGTFSNGSIVESTVYNDANITSALSNVKYADGGFTIADVNATDWALSLAGLYELSDVVNLYANFSKGFFFPQLRGFTPIATGVTGSKYDSEKIIQFEAGTKIGNDKLTGSLAMYYVSLKDRIKITQAIVNGSLVDQTRSEQNTATFGLEATWDYKLTEVLNFRGSATYQNHEITKNINEDLVNGGTTIADEGNKLARQPNILGSLGLYYDNSKFDTMLSMNYTGKKFAADNNNIELEAISILRLGAGYSMNLGENDETLRLGFSVFNALDSDAVTEGDPRAVGQVEEEFFFGRPILPRRVFLTATFNF